MTPLKWWVFLSDDDSENNDSFDHSNNDSARADATFVEDPDENNRFNNTRSTAEDSDDEEGFLSRALNR